MQRMIVGWALALGALLTGASLVADVGAASAAPTARITIQNISKGVIGETDFGAVSVTYTVAFKCHGAPVGTFLQVETDVRQGPGAGDVGPYGNAAFGFAGARCTGTSQKVTVVNIADPFYPDIQFVPGSAEARATVYGCPDGSEEFCDGFITEETSSIKLVT